MAGYWLRAFFAFLRTDTKSRSIKRPPKKRLLSSYLDRTKDLLFRKKLRFIKNKEWHVYFERRKRKPSGESCMFLYFDCLLPLYSTTDTVQKLRTFFFAPNFLSCTGSQRYISSGHDGLILLARLATQNIERVILSGWRRALLINPLHPNISMQILLTVLCTYPIVLSREIDLSIRGSFTYWSFSLFS